MFKKGKCPICGNYNEMTFSNNPLVPSICFKCAADKLNYKNLEHADYFCRTYNIPFNPTKWINIVRKEKTAIQILKAYTAAFLNENKKNLFYTTTTQDLWKEANIEWERSMTHAELLRRIEPIMDDFIERGLIKWGTGYNFGELIQLENLYSSTISMFDVNNPMQIDSIKKACKLSVMIDKSVEAGDVKKIKELTSAYAGFVKTAKIDEMIESSQTDVIRTVADLVDHLEKGGFEFTYYDNFERDIVDTTIRVMKDYLRTLVLESTGLEQTLELIQEKYLQSKQDMIAEKATKELDLERIVEVAKEENTAEIDKFVNSDDIMSGYSEEDF